MRALSIRQPFAELILRGIKTVEYRSRATQIVGERFWIYASKKPGVAEAGFGGARPRVWSSDLAAPGSRGEPAPPDWLLELARMVKLIEPGSILPTGVIVGSAVIEQVTPPVRDDGFFRWHLANVERLSTPRVPTGRPQPVWFAPFG